MSATECPTCGATVEAGAPFCSECGSPAPAGDGVEARLRRYWSAPDLGLVAGGALAVVGIVLLGAQAWLWALLALGLAAVVLVLRIEAGRRATGAALARVSAQRRVVGARSRGQIELFRLRRELVELQAERSRAYQELGRSTHEGDAPGARQATVRVDDVAVLITAKEEEIAVLLSQMEQRVRQAQAEVTPTSRLEAPPEPARVPEPFPPPDEGNPPEPARVPEPSPDDPVPEPEPPPAPETGRAQAARSTNT
jgi:hypothetical protein